MRLSMEFSLFIYNWVFVFFFFFFGAVLISNQLQSTDNISIWVNNSGPFIGGKFCIFYIYIIKFLGFWNSVMEKEVFWIIVIWFGFVLKKLRYFELFVDMDKVRENFWKNFYIDFGYIRVLNWIFLERRFFVLW